MGRRKNGETSQLKSQWLGVTVAAVATPTAAANYKMGVVLAVLMLCIGGGTEN